MSKSTSFNLGEHFDAFIKERIAMGRYGNKGEMMRAGLRLLEQEEKKLDLLRQHLAEGEAQTQQGEFVSVDKDHFKQIKTPKRA